MADTRNIQGFTVLAEGQQPVVADIIFVHGLRGNAIGTWTKKVDKLSVCWPKELLPNDLPHARIMTWGYDSMVANLTSLSSQSSMFCYAEDLLGDAVHIRKFDDQKNRPIVFVGHGLGGLVIKQALIRSAEYLHNKQDIAMGRLYTCTAGVVFFGTPHRGSDKAGLAQLVTDAAKFAFAQPNSKLIDGLKRDSDVLEQQRKSFASITDSMSLFCFVEQKPTRAGMIVPLDSAVIDGFRVKSFSIPGDHSEMCKFASADEIGYKRSAGCINDIVQSAVEKQENRAAENVASEQQKLIESLNFKTMDYRYQDITEAHAKTFDWCYNEPGPGLVQWLQNGSGIFWVNGKAGSGKSTLMKFLFDDKRTKAVLTRNSGQEHQSKVGFFFSDRGTDLERSLTGLLRSILLQILSSFPDLVPMMLPQYRRGLGRLSHPGEEVDEWLDRDLRSALEMITKQTTVAGNVCMFIDGLDEYNGDHEEIVKLFGSIVASSNVRSMKVKMCVSSRPLTVFEHGFRLFQHLKVQDLTSQDIKRYAFETFQSYGSMDKPLLDAVTLNHKSSPANLVTEIVRKASGVFLWVRLLVKSLGEGLRDGDSISELYDRLAALPSDLEDLYRNMLQKIPPGYRETATQLFEIVYEVNDIDIEFDILQLALAVDGPELALKRPCTPWGQQAEIARSRQMADRVQSRCVGLIEVLACEDPGDFCNSKVQLIHQTFKEFLEAPNNHQYSRSRPSSVSPCTAILSSFVSRAKIRDFGVNAEATTNVDEELENYYCIFSLDFALLAEHMGSEDISVPVRLVDELDKVLQRRWGKIGSHWSEKSCMRNFSITRAQPHTVSNIFVWAAGASLDFYVEEKLESGQVNIRAKPYCYSLFQVVWRMMVDDGESSIACNAVILPKRLKLLKMLLEHGASPNDFLGGVTAWQFALDRILGDSRPIEEAWEYHESWLPLLHTLLDYGAIPDLQEENQPSTHPEVLLLELFPERLNTIDTQLQRLKDELWERVKDACLKSYSRDSRALEKFLHHERREISQTSLKLPSKERPVKDGRRSH